MASEDMVVCLVCANRVTKGNAVQVILYWAPTLDKVEWVYVCRRKCHWAYVDAWSPPIPGMLEIEVSFPKQQPVAPRSVRAQEGRGVWAQQAMASEDVVVCQMCAKRATKENAVQVIFNWAPTLDKVEWVYVCSQKCHRAYVDALYSDSV